MSFFLTDSGPFRLGSMPLTQPPPGYQSGQGGQQQGVLYRITTYYFQPYPGYHQAGPGHQQGDQLGSNTGKNVQVNNVTLVLDVVSSTPALPCHFSWQDQYQCLSPSNIKQGQDTNSKDSCIEEQFITSIHLQDTIKQGQHPNKEVNLGLTQGRRCK